MLQWYNEGRPIPKRLVQPDPVAPTCRNEDAFEFKSGKVGGWNVWGRSVHRTPATRWLHSTARRNVSSRDPRWNVCRICWNTSRAASNTLANYMYRTRRGRVRISFVFAQVGLLASRMINSRDSVSGTLLLSVKLAIAGQVKFSMHLRATNTTVISLFCSFGLSWFLFLAQK